MASKNPSTMTSGSRFLDGAVKVEQLLRLAESRRQLVFGRTFRWGTNKPACIRDNFAFDVVDRDGDAVGHHALGTKADAEIHDGFRRQAALLRQIWMTALQLVEAEFQRCIGHVAFRCMPCGDCG